MLLFKRVLHICLLLTLYMVTLVSSIDLTTSAKVAFDSVKGCECQKGEKGSPGFVVAMRGAKGDPGIPGTCSTTCSDLTDLKICSKVTLSLGRKILTNDEESQDEEIYKRTTSDYDSTLLNQLRQGVISVYQLSNEQAESILAYCITAGLRGTEIFEKGEKGEVGERGESGTPGINGTKGEKGVKGDPGISMKEKTGEKGEKGCIGELGPMGHTGLPGSAGLPGPPGKSGVAFIRWGENWCPHSSQLLLKGLAFNFKNKHNELLCIRTLSKPSVTIGNGSTTHQLSPIMYSGFVFNNRYLSCAHCNSPNKAAMFVQFGAEVCPIGWRTEYKGYAVSTKTSDVVCLQDRVAKGINWKSSHPRDLQLINISCPFGAAVCNGYLSTDSLTCAVCTK